MRNSIVYLLFLVCFNAMSMDKPPQKPVEPSKTLQISPEQFAQATQTEGSYLKLLPLEIIKMLKDLTYHNLAVAVHAMRTSYLKDPLYSLILSKFPDANQRLVDALKDKVKTLKLPADINLTDQEVVAILLNTPASFLLLKGNFQTMQHAFVPNPKVISPEKIAILFMTYAKQAELNYEEAVSYAHQLLRNMENAGLRNYSQYEKDGFTLTVMNFLLKEYLQKFTTYAPILPEIQILIDMGASSNISRLISYGSDVNASWAYLYAQLKKRLNAKPEAAVCNSLAELLMQALSANNHQKIETILNSLFFVTVLDESFAACFSQKLKGQLGASLVNYLMQSDAHVLPFQSAFYPHFIEILWNQAINNASINAQKLTRLLSCFNFDTSFTSRVKLPFAYPIDTMMAQAGHLKKLANKFLMDVVRKGLADENNVIMLLNQNADYNQVDDQGTTFLMHAIKNGWIWLVRLLLDEKDINKNACDKQGHNALWYARNLETDMGTRLAIIQLLQQAGVTEDEACVVQ